MPRSANYIPSLRVHNPSGQAVVTIDGRDVYLGRQGSPEAQERYDRVIGEWLQRGRQSAGADAAAVVKADRAVAALTAVTETPPISVNEVCLAYLNWAKTFYVRDGETTEEFNHVKRCIRVLRGTYGSLPANDFGPLKLKAVRERFIAGDLQYDNGANRAARPQARPHVNANVMRIKRMFRWATENEMVPASVWHGLQSVAGLRRGKCVAKEGRTVKPVPEMFVEAVLREDTTGTPMYVSREVAAVIRLQMLTGARSSELLTLKTGEIDMSGPEWSYSPARHKTENHGATRMNWFGKRAQDILRPWLRANLTEFLFSPRSAMERIWEAKRTARKTRVQPSQLDRKRRVGRQRNWQDRYDAGSYRKAILAGIRALNRGREADGQEPIPAWHPHQLRHNHGTMVRRQFGIEVAKAVLGHRDIRATAIYAELDSAKAREVAAQVG